MEIMRFLLCVVASAVPAYILGSVNGAIIIAKWLFKKDIREYGSGNPGLTNFYRVFGKGGALLVVAIDVIKTVAPVLLGGFLFGRIFEMMLFGRAISGLFVALGHCFPVFYRFKGGKGVMAIGTIIIIIDWRIAIVSWGLFILISAVTKYVSLGSIIGVLAYPALMPWLEPGKHLELIIAIMCAVLLIARHQSNLKRLMRGEESKFSFKRQRD